MKKVYFSSSSLLLRYTHWPCLSFVMPCMQCKERERAKLEEDIEVIVVERERERERGRGRDSKKMGDALHAVERRRGREGVKKGWVGPAVVPVVPTEE